MCSFFVEVDLRFLEFSGNSNSHVDNINKFKERKNFQTWSPGVETFMSLTCRNDANFQFRAQQNGYERNITKTIEKFDVYV